MSRYKLHHDDCLGTWQLWDSRPREWLGVHGRPLRYMTREGVQYLERSNRIRRIGISKVFDIMPPNVQGNGQAARKGD